MRPKRVGFLGFEGFAALDLVGPIGSFCGCEKPLVYETD